VWKKARFFDKISLELREDDRYMKKQKKNDAKKKKLLIKRLKFVTLLLVVVLILELCYVGYRLVFRSEESIYFDGINAIESTDTCYASVGSNNDNDNYYEKAKITKYNKKKEKTFEKLYNVGYNSSFFGVTSDGDSLVAVGSYEKTATDHENLVRRALIVKYDASGNVEFEKDFKLLDNSKFTNIIKVGEDYYVTGQSVYKSTKIGAEEGGAVLAKFDKDGNLLWSKTYGSSKSAIYNDLIVVDDAIYVVGTDENYLGLICKYDMNGNLLEYNDYKSTDTIGFSGIVAVDGKIYVCGACRINDNDTDAMIVQYDLDCNYEKQVIYNSKGLARFNKISKDSHDNLVVIGTSAIYLNEVHDGYNEFNYDGIVGKYDTNLEKIDAVTYGDKRDDYFTDIKVVDDSYLVVGYSEYEDGSYLSKFISYSSALKVLEVEA